MTYEAHLEGWESQRLSTGRVLSAAEHTAVLSIGDLMSRVRLPSDMPEQLVELLRLHQNDPLGGLKALSQIWKAPAIELDLYRRSWRDVMDAAFQKLLQEKAETLTARDVPPERVHRLVEDLGSWRNRLAVTREERGAASHGATRGRGPRRARGAAAA